MASVSIQGEVELTQADYVEAYSAYARSKGFVKSLVTFLGLLVFFTGGIVAVAWPVRPGLWTVLIPACLVMMVLSWWQWRWIGRRAFSNLPAARRRYAVELRDGGMYARGDKAETSYAWRHLDGWIESSTLFVFIGPSGVTDLCPKRAFEAEALDDVRELLAARIPVRPSPSEKKKRKPSAQRTLLVWVILVAVFIAIYNIWMMP